MDKLKILNDKKTQLEHDFIFAQKAELTASTLFHDAESESGDIKAKLDQAVADLELAKQNLKAKEAEKLNCQADVDSKENEISSYEISKSIKEDELLAANEELSQKEEDVEKAKAHLSSLVDDAKTFESSLDNDARMFDDYDSKLVNNAVSVGNAKAEIDGVDESKVNEIVESSKVIEIEIDGLHSEYENEANELEMLINEAISMVDFKGLQDAHDNVDAITLEVEKFVDGLKVLNDELDELKSKYEDSVAEFDIATKSKKDAQSKKLKLKKQYDAALIKQNALGLDLVNKQNEVNSIKNQIDDVDNQIQIEQQNLIYGIPGPINGVDYTEDDINKQLVDIVDLVDDALKNAGSIMTSSVFLNSPLVKNLKSGVDISTNLNLYTQYNAIKAVSQDIANKASGLLGSAGIMSVHGAEIWVNQPTNPDLKSISKDKLEVVKNVFKAVNTVAAFTPPTMKPKQIQFKHIEKIVGDNGDSMGQPAAPIFKIEKDFENKLSTADKKLIKDAHDLLEANASKEYMPSEFIKDNDGNEYLRVSTLPWPTVLSLTPAFQTTCKMDLSKRQSDNDADYGHGLPRYTASYRQFNAWLRNLSMPSAYSVGEAESWAKDCDKDLEDCIIPMNMIVKRGIGSVPAGFNDLEVGDKFTDQGVISASMTSNGAFKGPVLLFIRIKKGSHASFATPYSAFQPETEIILPRKSIFQVVAIDKKIYPMTIWCELLQ